jgi:glycosyltransferase involved in cell wall biosynthesis
MMGKNNPLISVIMPVYNGAGFIAEAIDSIQQQNYSPLEIIIIDDGSTDDTKQVVSQIDDNIHYLYQTNQGPSVARNRGLGIAAGEIITFLDADDLWPTDKLQIQVPYLLNHSNLEFILGRIQYISLPGAQDIKIQLAEDETLAFVHLGSGIYRNSAFKKVGFFEETLRYSEDHDWFLRARELGLPFKILEHITLYYRLHGQNMTRNKSAQDFQLLTVLKKSLDRRRRQNEGAVQALPRFLDFESDSANNQEK